jgi:hypothetical protein
MKGELIYSIAHNRKVRAKKEGSDRNLIPFYPISYEKPNYCNRNIMPDFFSLKYLVIEVKIPQLIEN